jgi:hypothetical protein
MTILKKTENGGCPTNEEAALLMVEAPLSELGVCIACVSRRKMATGASA